MEKEFENIEKPVFGHDREPAAENIPLFSCFSPCLRDEPALSLPKGGAKVLFFSRCCHFDSKT